MIYKFYLTSDSEHAYIYQANTSSHVCAEEHYGFALPVQITSTRKTVLLLGHWSEYEMQGCQMMQCCLDPVDPQSTRSNNGPVSQY